jgi:hypothetical protein
MTSVSNISKLIECDLFLDLKKYPTIQAYLREHFGDRFLSYVKSYLDDANQGSLDAK